MTAKMIFIFTQNENKTIMETWKPIVDCPGYEVSSGGQIRSPYRTRKLQKNWEGYHEINILQKKHKVHRLVAHAFIPNPDNKPVVDHIDGNKSNNHVSNLRWATVAENNRNKTKKSRNSQQTKKPRNSQQEHVGVRQREYNGYGINSWEARWSENGKAKSKHFKSLEEAVAYRQKVIQQLA